VIEYKAENRTAEVGVAAALGFGLWRLAQPLPEPGDLTLRLVQPNAEQSAKWEAARAQEFPPWWVTAG